MKGMEDTRRALVIDGRSLTLDEVAEVAMKGRPVVLSEGARERVAASRRVIDGIVASGQVVYGVNTGFGRLAEVRISAEEVEHLQLNLLRSHACGVGDPFPREVVRAMLLLRANVLSSGFAGCRPDVVEAVLSLLNGGVHPVVPSQGSVGASGDLAPLAHLALVLVGEGEAELDGERMPGREALRRSGLEPIVLGAKEGLALINGTQASAAVGALAVWRARRLVDAADVCCALTLDAMEGTDTAFMEAIHAARPHAGQGASAARLRRLLEGSEIRSSHVACTKVQDAYSLRCAPQVHGAARDALEHVGRLLEIEINSATDNPMVFPDGRVVSGGNFHGAPISAPMDYLAAALTGLASISERRLARMVDTSLSGLPPFLTERAGLNSGFMMVQVSAAALVSECKTLSHPASVDSIPTSASQEDHVSMSTWAARKLSRVVEMLRQVLAMEYVAGAQGVEFHRPMRSSEPLETAIGWLREEVPVYGEDREHHRDVAVAARILPRLSEL